MNKPDLHIVSLSGGKDSTAMLLRMLEEKMPVDVILFCDTGLEFDAMYKHIDKLEKYINKPFPNGESLKDVEKRVKEFLEDIKDLKGKNILIVSHSGVNMFVNFYMKNRNIKKDEVEHIPFENCGVMKYEF